jgi:hypothetical protein
VKVHIIYDPNQHTKAGQHGVVVHKAGCADIKKAIATATSHYLTDTESQKDAALDFWSDFIAEESMTETQAIEQTGFAPCTKGLPVVPNGTPGPEALGKLFPIGTGSKTRKRQPKPASATKGTVTNIKARRTRKATPKPTGSQPKPTPAPAPKPTKLSREQKTQLATVIVTAAASVMDQLDGVGLKGVSQEDAAKCVAQWLHHLPVDRARWPKELPKPDRSDWR